MKNKTAIKVVLGQLEFLLSQHGEPEWAKAVCRFQIQIEDNDPNGRYNLRSLFGGMGSLNDVLLQKNAKPLFSENDELVLAFGAGPALGQRAMRRQAMSSFRSSPRGWA